MLCPWIATGKVGSGILLFLWRLGGAKRRELFEAQLRYQTIRGDDLPDKQLTNQESPIFKLTYISNVLHAWPFLADANVLPIEERAWNNPLVQAKVVVFTGSRDLIPWHVRIIW